MRGITCGSFDLLHAGHILFLKNCKDHCDNLTVALQVNPKLDRNWKHKPIQSLIEREIQLLGCKYVDKVLIYETEADLEILLETVKFDIRFMGDDWANKEDRITAYEAVPIKYIDRNHRFSSSELRERIKKS